MTAFWRFGVFGVSLILIGSIFYFTIKEPTTRKKPQFYPGTSSLEQVKMLTREVLELC
jgi:preprotein translocase subunit YajC